ncbi:hypothetical protein F5Y17DRAFT_160744 [Xylariaceae sp. FL0594]|nr:hypothetical protein F5Y17DRAFT_160744 [Xylariaceae sp. FL0594]
MSILCCCRQRQTSGRDTHSPAIELPAQPPRARLSKTLSRSDTDMYLSSILSSRDPSRLNTATYQSIVDPEAVDVDDSDDDDDGDMMQQRERNVPSPGTLGALKTKLIRRFSHRAGAKYGCPTSSGASDEELARRAELKRLMHKRIQDELENEEDEMDEIRHASPEQQNISKCRGPVLPGGGPRDTIEFSVSAVQGERGSQELSQGEAAASNKGVPDTEGSCAGSNGNCTRNSCDDCNASVREAGLGNQPASPSHLVPVHLLGGSGRSSPSTASWCLSYSASHLDSRVDPMDEASDGSRLESSALQQDVSSSRDIDSLHQQKGQTTDGTDITIRDEPIETGHETHEKHATDIVDNGNEHNVSLCSNLTNSGRNSPLAVWLRSQDMHCTSILSSRPNSGTGREHFREADAPSSQMQEECLTSDSTGMPENKGQIMEPPPSVLSEESPEAWLKPPEGVFDVQTSPIAAPSNESVALHQVLTQMEDIFARQDPSTEDHGRDTSSRYTSSRYTTRPNSQLASPRDSGLSVAERRHGSGIREPFSTVYGPVSPYQTATGSASAASSYRTAINKMPSVDSGKNRPGNSQLSVAEVLSGSGSETASFKQREEELRSVKKRFSLTPTRWHPPQSVRSKFREEFDDAKGSGNARTSLLSKIYLALPKRGRAASSQSECSRKSHDENKASRPELRNSTFTRPSTRGPNAQPHDIVAQPIAEESAKTLWERALQQEADHSSGWMRVKLTETPTPKIDINGSTTVMVPVQPSEGSDSPKAHSAEEERECWAEDCGPGLLNPATPATVSRKKSTDPIDIQSGVLQEWVEQLQAEDALRQSRTASRVTVPKQRPPRLRTPPESWARWPSSTRAERTASAGAMDGVCTRDFAESLGSDTLGSEAGARVWSKGGEVVPSSKKFSTQVSKAFKSGWNRVMVNKIPLSDNPNEAIVKGSQRRQDFLEYPELELLPTAGCFQEVQAIEQQIDTMKRRSVSGRRMVQSSSESAQRPLTSRIVEEVHKRQLEDENGHEGEGKYPGRYPSGSPFLTPAHALFVPRSKSCIPDMVGTSQAQPRQQSADSGLNQAVDDGDDANDALKRQDAARLKRAQSTGNIDGKRPKNAVPVIGVDQCRDKPTQSTWRSTLQRQKSLGWIYGSSSGQGTSLKEG